jgi:hypothetical protein
VINENSTVEIVNSVVWGNVDPGLGKHFFHLHDSSSILRVFHSCVDVEASPRQCGSGTFLADPLFVESGTYDWGRYALVFFPQIVQRVDLPDFRSTLGDYHLQPGSPCIDRGTAIGAPADDLVGRARPCGRAVDIGAFEECLAVVDDPRFLRGDCNGDGITTGVSDAVHILISSFLGGAEVPCRAACDVNAVGAAAAIPDAVALLIFNFAGGIEIPAPFPTCGASSLASDKALGCPDAKAVPAIAQQQAKPRMRSQRDAAPGRRHGAAPPLRGPAGGCAGTPLDPMGQRLPQRLRAPVEAKI